MDIALHKPIMKLHVLGQLYFVGQCERQQLLLMYSLDLLSHSKYSIVGNFCGVLIFVIFVVHSAGDQLVDGWDFLHESIKI